MKKRLLLILAVGIAFSPSVFAVGFDGPSVVGPFNRSIEAGTAGAAFCKAGQMLKSYAQSSESGKQVIQQADSDGSSAGNGS